MVYETPAQYTAMDKAYILREIKRTAEANGGKPLGMGRFRKETGIKRQDWSGVYWAKWSDAVREAGYEPNLLEEAYEPTELLGLYAQLVRELGHLPTNAELQLKARSATGFPSTATFAARWPTKADLVAQVLEFCKGKDDYKQVAQFCEEYVPAKQQDEPSEPSEDEVVMGFVYLIKMGRYYKIGMTNHVGRREYELSLQLPEQPELIHQISTDDPKGIEEYWHKRFAAKRTNGEWFAPDASEVAAFKRRKFM
jgi:hypothetical protein